MDRNTTAFTSLPSDVLLQIFAQCNVFDILNVSSTCKQLRQVADEHQVWLQQAIRRQVPIPPGATPSKARLKDLVISRTRAQLCWTKHGRPGALAFHSFQTDTEFVDAHLIPGGEFVALLYRNGDVGLDRIERSEDTGGLNLREVTRYEEPDRGNYPYYWSRLLTETSHGCPVIVCAGIIHKEAPSVFLIDTVSQVIERKQYIRFVYQGPGLQKSRILAMKNAVFFIREGLGRLQIIVVAGSGRDQAIRRFNLNPPVGGDIDHFDNKPGVFLVSENGLIVSDHLGIHLYHIPELRAVHDDFALVPVWSWRGNASRCRGTLYKTVSPFPALWLHGEQITHSLEFDMDEFGDFPFVVKHRITERPPAYYLGRHLKLQGRKAMGIDVKRGGDIVFRTGVLGNPDLTRELHAPLPGMWAVYWYQLEEMKYTDLDEATGRIMVVIGTVAGQRGAYNIPYARRLCLADLPA